MSNVNRHDIRIDQGATYEQTYQYLASDGVTPIDLTGCTAAGQVRATADAADPALADFEITITPLTGTIKLLLKANVTLALPVGDAVWDVLLTFPDETVKRFMEGTVVITAGVTRE